MNNCEVLRAAFPEAQTCRFDLFILSHSAMQTDIFTHSFGVQTDVDSFAATNISAEIFLHFVQTMLLCSSTRNHWCMEVPVAANTKRHVDCARVDQWWLGKLHFTQSTTYSPQGTSSGKFAIFIFGSNKQICRGKSPDYCLLKVFIICFRIFNHHSLTIKFIRSRFIDDCRDSNTHFSRGSQPAWYWIHALQQTYSNRPLAPECTVYL